MRRPSPHAQQPGPPFNAPAARRLRAALGMGPEHVAHALCVSYGLPYVTPDHVIAWERGTLTPSSPELTALAGVLWCSPGELIGRPRTLREHRIARGLAPEDVARAVGMDLPGYLRMEETGKWRGNDRQGAGLAEALRLSPAELVTVTGREARLVELLHSAVSTRWQAYVRPVGKVVSLDRRVLEGTLRRLHEDYQGRMAATLSWGGGGGESGEAGREYLAGIVDTFWAAVEDQRG
ncbi:helix-turn-helix domain-containing protein [Streptomyces sp. bgisy159]|uniref:helix-turn-helix domain-containing protein n=1 Tax=Streptomyces sp. bgisy159 TaxID=3413795 RepID=UPI003F49E183